MLVMTASTEYNRNMAIIQIESVSGPFQRPDIARLALSIIIKADAMGMLPDKLHLQELGWREMGQVIGHIGRAGLSRKHVAELLSARPGHDPLAALTAMDKVLDETPVPDSEWSSMLGMFDPEPLGSLLGISPSSVRRYADGARRTPDAICSRLHLIALLVSHLSGMYNDYGIRRWFSRPRTALDGSSPSDLLIGDWDPDDEGPCQVMDLARSLHAGGAT